MTQCNASAGTLFVSTAFRWRADIDVEAPEPFRRERGKMIQRPHPRMERQEAISTSFTPT